MYVLVYPRAAEGDEADFITIVTHILTKSTEEKERLYKIVAKSRT